jgi:phage-related protein
MAGLAAIVLDSYTKTCIIWLMIKPVEFLGDSLDALRRFPQDARRQAGFQLDRVQHGLDPDDWKPMTVRASRRFVFAMQRERFG